MDTETDLKQRRALADWRATLTGKAFMVGAAGGAITTGIASAADSGLLYALAPFVALAGIGVTLTGSEPPRY